MTALALEWFWWIFATFGIVGIVALWIFAPTAATLIGKAILAFFKFVFGYRIGCAIVAAILAFLAADYHRARLEEADGGVRCRAAETRHPDRRQRPRLGASRDRRRTTSLHRHRQTEGRLRC